MANMTTKQLKEEAEKLGIETEGMKPNEIKQAIKETKEEAILIARANKLGIEVTEEMEYGALVQLVEDAEKKAKAVPKVSKPYAINFEVGDVVINSSASFSRVLALKNGVYIGTKWRDSYKDARDDGDVGGCRFNARACLVMQIKKATK